MVKPFGALAFMKTCGFPAYLSGMGRSGRESWPRGKPYISKRPKQNRKKHLFYTLFL